MSQLISLISDAPATAVAVLLVTGTWALLVLATALVATFHRSSEHRDAAIRVLDRLLRCLPRSR